MNEASLFGNFLKEKNSQQAPMLGKMMANNLNKIELCEELIDKVIISQRQADLSIFTTTENYSRNQSSLIEQLNIKVQNSNSKITDEVRENIVQKAQITNLTEADESFFAYMLEKGFIDNKSLSKNKSHYEINTENNMYDLDDTDSSSDEDADTDDGVERTAVKPNNEQYMAIDVPFSFIKETRQLQEHSNCVNCCDCSHSSSKLIKSQSSVVKPEEDSKSAQRRGISADQLKNFIYEQRLHQIQVNTIIYF